MNLIKNSFRKVKSFLRNMKDILENMQEIIRGVLQALARINTAARLSPLIGGSVLN